MEVILLKCLIRAKLMTAHSRKIYDFFLYDRKCNEKINNVIVLTPQNRNFLNKQFKWSGSKFNQTIKVIQLYCDGWDDRSAASHFSAGPYRVSGNFVETGKRICTPPRPYGGVRGWKSYPETLAKFGEFAASFGGVAFRKFTSEHCLPGVLLVGTLVQSGDGLRSPMMINSSGVGI